jgi:hypothetical protein
MAHNIGRKRRRWLIVALGLVLGSGWWFWPRVDLRLVGTWELNTDSSGLTGFKLFANGLGEIAGVTNSDGEGLRTPWKVEGDVLMISQQQTEYDGLREWIELQMHSAWERILHPDEAFRRWRITEVKTRSLTLESLEKSERGRVSTYHRLPDGADIHAETLRWPSP